MTPRLKALFLGLVISWLDVTKPFEDKIFDLPSPKKLEINSHKYSRYVRAVKMCVINDFDRSINVSISIKIC